MLDALALTALYETHSAYLWGLGYRLLGTVEDADDVLQETFVRLLEHPPQAGEPAGLPWLTRAALDVGRPLLAERQDAEYPGPWLPGPVPDARLAIPGMADAGRLLDSGRVSFLLALELLRPDARAALLLVDVFAQPADFAAAGLGVDAARLQALLAEARLALADWAAPDAERLARTEARLDALVAAARASDAAAIQALCASDLRVRCDGGVFAVVDRRGPEAAAAFACSLAQGHGKRAKVQVASLNHAPAALWRSDAGDSGAAETSVLRIELDADGRIGDLQCVQAPAKLGGVWGFGLDD